MAAANNVNLSELERLQGKVIGDVGGTLGVLLAYIGDQTGVYRAMTDLGPATAKQIAQQARVDERYACEWLSCNAAAGYVTYDAAHERFSLSPEQALVFAREGDPACMQGFFQLVVSQFLNESHARQVFASGAGLPWGAHHACCFCGVDRFFRAGYAAQLVTQWIPKLEGVHDRLTRGAKVVDIGCGYGSSTLLMAQAYPQSLFFGFDFHSPSIEEARIRAERAGLSNVQFEVATAKTFSGTGYDLACIFDALHDMGDPVGAATHVRKCLSQDGTFMIVEPMAGDSLSENLNIIGQIFYAASTLVCCPASKAQEVGLALGAQAGQRRLTSVLNQAGFTRVRRVAETPLNMVLEARA
jgi:ubiquinone/menaquinone biosynthesis C-methylase UbiE